MREEFSKLRGGLVLAAAVVALLLVAGCGGSGDTTEVTVGKVAVKTGSLSKDEFVEKANEICREIRKEFNADYEKFLAAKTSGKRPAQATLAKEIVESVAVPHLSEEIEQISELGAPQEDAKDVASYLNALERRLDEGKENPIGLIFSQGPFKKPAALAGKAGLNGCAESLS